MLNKTQKHCHLQNRPHIKSNTICLDWSNPHCIFCRLTEVWFPASSANFLVSSIDSEHLPRSNDFSFGKRKKSHRAIADEHDAWSMIFGTRREETRFFTSSFGLAEFSEAFSSKTNFWLNSDFRTKSKPKFWSITSVIQNL